ncbi:amino acid permease [Bacillus sp. HMF5848]|uniref:amino acid permease n=1 Tax=Bacillus sp. HMF5848 TaxID=2495421 RepID=UPI000F7A6B88|nr:amino acid permease [Bacillus sp. HMF5848]
MKWWQLSLFGVGCIIGTGFFLGTSIAIRKTGPSIIIILFLAAVATYLVFDGLARMVAREPKKGAFRSYAQQAFGHWAGFCSGWVYWFSEVLIMGSQMTALSIFTKFWFPSVPLWIFACIYACLGLVILLIGVAWLNKLENLFAIIKVSAIVMFIIIALLGVFNVIDSSKPIKLTESFNQFFAAGISGFLSSMIFGFYAFGGVEVMGLLAIKLEKPKDAPKSGKIMLLILTFIYILSIGLAVLMINFKSFETDQSPFVTALEPFQLNFVPHIFNGALIIAGFSTMVASIYAVTTILITLAEEGDAPKRFAKAGKLAVPIPAFLITVFSLTASIVFSLLMPDKVYEYITTAAGLMLIYNWIFILLSARRLLSVGRLVKFSYLFGIMLIFVTVIGTLFSESSRPGFFISIGFIVIILVVMLFVRPRWKQNDNIKRSLFEKFQPTKS